LEALGIKRQIGWHSFRHGLATMLRQQGVDLKLAQAMFRHANSRITLQVYQQVVGTEKRDAQRRVMEVHLVPKLKGAELQDPQSLITCLNNARKPLVTGGDDEARTRDLCRDRAPGNRNLLKIKRDGWLLLALMGTARNRYCVLNVPATSAATTSAGPLL
jgi:hypothetical protein